MMDQMFDDVNLERRIYALFKLDVKIKAIITSNIPTSRSANATVFLTTSNLLFCFIDSKMHLTLGDVRKMVSRMNLTIEKILAPDADVDYFDNIAREKFNATFPGRNSVSDSDLMFYRTLAPYCPALIQVASVTGNVIRQYDSSAVGSWRPSVKFSYRRMRTS